MSIFKGAGVAIVTPMKSDLEVNYDTLAELLEEQIAGKTDAIIICGTTGESATMSEEEHSKVIRFAIERVNPVSYTHLGGKWWLVEPMAKAAVAAGADGLMIEVHNNPECALCDGAQSLKPEKYDTLLKEIKLIAEVVDVYKRQPCIC